MKNYIHHLAILLLSVSLFSCKQQPQAPPPPTPPPAVSSVAEAQKIVAGKTWQVMDAATISGSRKSAFDDDKLKNETVKIPAVETLNWFSQIKGIDTATDFRVKFYRENLEKFKQISIAFSKDSMATTTGMGAAQQLFSINNTTKEDEPNGIKLTLTGENKEFADMGKVTATYYILGADQNTLYLLTPNEMDDLKVVFLLKAK